MPEVYIFSPLLLQTSVSLNVMFVCSVWNVAKLWRIFGSNLCTWMKNSLIVKLQWYCLLCVNFKGYEGWMLNFLNQTLLLLMMKW